MALGETAHRLGAGRYTLLERIGRGGMGTVWRATDELLRRAVAVKHVALPAGLSDEERAAVRRRVLREAQAAARLNHPASVTVFDVLEDDESVHLVMELIDAPTLADTVELNGPLDVDEAARLGLQLVGALDAAHRQGIVHRDVKPSNVMMLPNGAVKLADFGIASVKDDPRLTGTGQVLGSPSYMAPEQALGEDSGPGADWWGVGATLYFAVEGRPPFDRPGALPTLTAVVNDDPAPAERAGPMASLLGRLLAKEPALRPDASELRDRLRALADARPSSAAAWTALGDDDGFAPSTPPPTTRTVPRPVGPPPAPAPPPPEPRSPRVEAEPVVEAPARPPRARPAPSAADRRSPSEWAVGALLAVVALLAGVLIWSSSRGGDNGGGDQVATSTTARAAETGADTDEAEADDAQGAGVPAEWVAYTDPRVGYRLSHPPGWRIRVLDGTRTDFVDPETGSYLRVDWTDTPGPSPEGAWESQSRSFGSRHEGYEEIRIEPTTYKGLDAAVWEYAYASGGGRLHAVNLGMVTGTHGFALNFQTREDRWEASQSLFESFKSSFQPPR